MRVVADHIRATTFLIADGVIPSNEWRGYVLRKIMRRAMRHGKHLGLHRAVPARARARPRPRDGRRVPRAPAQPRDDREDDPAPRRHRFETVLTEGLPRLEAEIAKVLGTPSKRAPGDAAFQLYDTFGVPYDFIEDTAATQGVTVDRAAFDARWKAQRDKARAGSAFGGGKKGEEFALGATTDAARRRRRSVRGLHDAPA